MFVATETANGMLAKLETLTTGLTDVVEIVRRLSVVDGPALLFRKNNETFPVLPTPRCQQLNWQATHNVRASPPASSLLLGAAGPVPSSMLPRHSLPAAGACLVPDVIARGEARSCGRRHQN